MSRFRKRLRTDEQGLSLLELVVVVLLLGIVSSILFNFLDNTLVVTTRATSSVVKENEVRQAMRELTQDIRAANKILVDPALDGSCGTVSTFPSAPSTYKTCIRFEVQRSVDATKACPKSVISYGITKPSATSTQQFLKKSRRDYAADCTTVTRNVTARTVLADLSNAAATPLFEYFNAANQPITTTDPAQKELYVKAQSIRINLWVKYKSGAPDIKVSSAVALRNNR
jgi:prepilin-type N-terminal cleavage/methylation domain-containing protein